MADSVHGDNLCDYCDAGREPYLNGSGRWAHEGGVLCQTPPIHCPCHMGSVCSAACDSGRHHEGCYGTGRGNANAPPADVVSSSTQILRPSPCRSAVGGGGDEKERAVRMYDPIWSAENAADDIDRKLLSPRACKECGFVMDNGLDDICNDCWTARYNDGDKE